RAVMASVTSDDITVAWGVQPPPIEAQTRRWRTGIFQDVQESSDGKLLYFLYDPILDERSGTSGNRRRGNNCIVVFDLYLRCFTQEIPLSVPGSPKFLFALRPLAVGGDTRAIVVSKTDSGGSGQQLHLTLLDLSTQGHLPITHPLDIGREFICTIREDAPELIVMANPGLQYFNVRIMVLKTNEPLYVWYDAILPLSYDFQYYFSCRVVFLLSSNTDGSLDYTRLHILDMQTCALTTTSCSADPRKGFPTPRVHAAIVTIQGFIAVCGGEVVDRRVGRVERMNDYWRLNLSSFQWEHLSGEMPVPLIEPRLTTTYGGHAYLWGDWDGNLPGI
ncbi:hypothetical protein PMAYCL1PPCAC_29172, partial [Pristionchus mayeri]